MVSEGSVSADDLFSDGSERSERLPKMTSFETPISSSDSSRSSLSSSPPNPSHRGSGLIVPEVQTTGLNPEKSYGEFRLQMPLLIPRTVPCIVLSPKTGESSEPSPYITSPLFPVPDVSPLDSIMAKISKLSNSLSPNIRENGSYAWKQSERHHEDNLRESVELYDSMKKIVKNVEVQNEESREAVSNKSYDVEHTSNEQKKSDKLSFGMDRILADEKPDKGKPDDAKPFPSFSNMLHKDLHPRLVSHCSDCYLLSRFCYKYSPPRSPAPSALCQSSLNCPSLWNSLPHLYEPNSTILLPNTGYSPLAVYPQKNQSSYAGIPSIVSCNTNGNGRRKRSWSRAVFSNLQRKGLEKRFQIQKYITKPDRRQLAATLGLTDAQVKVWFQNRRMKWRHTKEGKSGDGSGIVLNATSILMSPSLKSDKN